MTKKEILDKSGWMIHSNPDIMYQKLFEAMDEYAKQQFAERDEKVNRLEVINHAKNDKPVGRLLTLYSEMGDFNNIELAYQDGKRTLKIFLS